MTTSQPLTAAIYDSITEFQRTAHYSSLQHAQMRQYLAEHLAEALSAAGWAPQPEHDAAADEIRRLRDQLTAVTALCDEQDMAARLFELPTPEWITAVRRAIEDATAVSAPVRP
jgi:hypothetical protein